MMHLILHSLCTFPPPWEHSIRQLNCTLLQSLSNLFALNSKGKFQILNISRPTLFLNPFSFLFRQNVHNSYGGVWKSYTVYNHTHARPKGGGGGCVGCDRTPLLDVFFFFFCLRACYTGWWCTKIPLPRVWKIDQIFLTQKKKCQSQPPPAQQLFQDLRDFRGWRRTLCKIRTPVFKKLLYGPAIQPDDVHVYVNGQIMHLIKQKLYSDMILYCCMIFAPDMKGGGGGR